MQTSFQIEFAAGHKRAIATQLNRACTRDIQTIVGIEIETQKNAKRKGGRPKPGALGSGRAQRAHKAAANAMPADRTNSTIAVDVRHNEAGDQRALHSQNGVLLHVKRGAEVEHALCVVWHTATQNTS